MENMKNQKVLFGSCKLSDDRLLLQMKNVSEKEA